MLEVVVEEASHYLLPQEPSQRSSYHHQQANRVRGRGEKGTKAVVSQ